MGDVNFSESTTGTQLSGNGWQLTVWQIQIIQIQQITDSSWQTVDIILLKFQNLWMISVFIIHDNLREEQRINICKNVLNEPFTWKNSWTECSKILQAEVIYFIGTLQLKYP